MQLSIQTQSITHVQRQRGYDTHMATIFKCLLLDVLKKLREV